jgi:hypothetical protein
MIAKRKLLDQVRDVARFRPVSQRTEETYRDWIKRYSFYQNKRHPTEMGGDEINSTVAG